MKTEIDNYRGFEIRFDTHNETFECDIDDSRSVKKSYPSVKKFIDEYIKDNSEFKPFKVEVNPLEYMYASDGGVVQITGVRKDGNFVGVTADGKQQQISKYDMNKYIIPNSENYPIMEQCKAIRSEIDELHKRIGALQKGLIIKTLKDIASQYKSV